MYIINPNTFEKVTAATLARDFPNRSFSLPLSTEAMEELGYALFVPTEKPRGAVVTEAPPTLSGDGRWYQTWEVREYTDGALTPAERRTQLEAVGWPE